uniref:Uncharacterized protein n=1 Tax=Arundo donax TaxID=35708 RepID=A0A0A9FHN5_ARUDO
MSHFGRSGVPIICDTFALISFRERVPLLAVNGVLQTSPPSLMASYRLQPSSSPCMTESYILMSQTNHSIFKEYSI